MSADSRILALGDRFYAPEFDAYVTVMRVARDQSWADTEVVTYSGRWTKRQPLREGHLPYRIEYKGSVR